MSRDHKSKGRPTTRRRDEVSRAVAELRREIGETQKEFAKRLGVALATIARWETSRPPNGVALHGFAELARAHGRSKIAAIFENALSLESATDERDTELRHAVTLALVENNGSDWLQAELESLVKAAKAGQFELTYPLIYDRDHVPDQRARTEYLEGLLVHLRLQGAGSALKLLDTMAKQRAGQTGQDYHAAYTAVLLDNPELYTLYLQERADAAKGTSHESSLAPGPLGKPKKKKLGKGGTE